MIKGHIAAKHNATILKTKLNRIANTFIINMYRFGFSKLDNWMIGGALFMAVLFLFQVTRLIIIGTL